MRRGLTLIEVAVVTAIIAIIAGIGTQALLRRLDRSRVRHATAEIISALALARTTAIAREGHVSVLFDAAESAILVAAGHDTLVRRQLGDIYGVELRSNRDSATFGPTGLGYGAANQSVIVRRGTAIDTIIISRLGRVRH
jgi:prepilin-type N-terminal cleavage/methylation domain-containing protein